MTLAPVGTDDKRIRPSLPVASDGTASPSISTVTPATVMPSHCLVTTAPYPLLVIET